MPETDLLIERATLADLPGIVAVYADDDVSGGDDRWNDETRADYERGFRAIEASPDIELYVARRGRVVLGTIQVVFVPRETPPPSWTRADIYAHPIGFDGSRPAADSHG